MKDKKLTIRETRRLFQISLITVIVWAVTVVFSRVGTGAIFSFCLKISLVASPVCFAMHAFKLSFLSFLKIGGFLILVAAFWGLAYWIMPLVRGAFWVFSLMITFFVLTAIYRILFRLYGLQNIY